MNMMTAVAAVPAISMSSGTHAARIQTGAGDWNCAVERLKRAEAEYEQFEPRYSAAFDAAEAECPCPHERARFSQYELRCYEDQVRGRKRNEEAAHTAVYHERLDALVKSGSDRRYLTDEEAEEAMRDAHLIVDRFDDYRRRRDEAHNRYNCDEMETRLNDLVCRRTKAQEAVLHAQAPHLQAIHFKLELLTEMMDAEDDLPFVEALRDDVRRLLAH